MTIGLIVGALAKLVMIGRDPGEVFVTLLLWDCWIVSGRFFGRLLGLYGPNQGAGFIVSTLGAILLLAYYRFVQTHRHPTVGVRR